MTSTGQHKVMAHELDLSCICDGNMLKLITTHAHALGVPDEYVFFPLLSCVAGIMGQSEILVNEEWREKCVLWCGVIGRRGSRRTSTLNRFISAAMSLKAANMAPEVHGRHHLDSIPELDELKNDVHLNTVFHEDLAHVFDLLGKNNLHSGINRLKRLYDMNLTRSATSNLNVTGFVVSKDIYTFLQKAPIELTSRLLLAWPKPVLFYSRDYRVPMPANTPSLREVFEVLWYKHTEPRVYHMKNTAKALFHLYSDQYLEKIREFGDEESKYCHLSKAPAQLARVGLVLSALRQALKVVVYHEEMAQGSWSLEINEEDIEAAKIIMDYILVTKFAILREEFREFLERQHSMSSAICMNMININSQHINSHQVNSHQVNSHQVNSHQTNSHQAGVYPSPNKRQRLSEDSSNSSSPVEEKSTEGSSHIPMKLVTTAGAHVPTTLPYHMSASTVASMFRNMPPPPLLTSPHIPQQFRAMSETEMLARMNANLSHGDGAVTPSSQQVDTPSTSASTYTNGGTQPTTSSSGHSKHEVDTRAFFFRSSLDQPLGLFNEDPEKFVEEYAVKLKKLIEFRMDYRISPSTCAQRHLIPPLSRSEMLKYDTQTKYPVQVAKEFLIKVAQLGFGSIETVIHPANKRRSSFFQKYPYDQLSPEAKAILQKLHVSEQDYMAAFMPNGGRDAVYGFPYQGSGSQSGANMSPPDGQYPPTHYGDMTPPRSGDAAHHPGSSSTPSSTGGATGGHSQVSVGAEGSQMAMEATARQDGRVLPGPDHLLPPLPKTEPMDMHDSEDSQL